MFVNTVTGETVAFVPAQLIEQLIDQLWRITDDAPGSDTADKIEDVAQKAETVLEELNKTPPDNQAALGSIEGAVGDLEAAVSDRLLPVLVGSDFLNRFTAAARILAHDAIETALAGSGDSDEIAEAQKFLADGDSHWAEGEHKDAVANYKDALAKAESAAY